MDGVGTLRNLKELVETSNKKSELKKPDQNKEITNSFEKKESPKIEKDFKENEIELKSKKEIDKNKINNDVSAFSLSSLNIPFECVSCSFFLKFYLNQIEWEGVKKALIFCS